jgi:hypothetical protein
MSATSRYAMTTLAMTARITFSISYTLSNANTAASTTVNVSAATTT